MIRELLESEVTFKVTAEQDDLPVRGNAMVSGDDDEDRKVEDEILRRLDQGDVWAWACVKVTARWRAFAEHAYLGSCSYESEADFIACNDYLPDMKKEALARLNETLRAHEHALRELQVSP